MISLSQAINLTRKQIEREIQRRLDKILVKSTVIPKTPDNIIDWTTKVRKIQDKDFSFHP